MRWIKREEYYSGFCVYMANILAPRWIADIDPLTGRIIGERRPYNNESLCTHIAHRIPGALNTPANTEFRYSASTGSFVAVYA